MMSNLLFIADIFGFGSFADMLGSIEFWVTMAVIIGCIIAVLYSIRYWKQGGKFIIVGLFVIINVIISAYSLIQINYYYNTSGGIHGAITGIFKTNEIEVVDELSFKLKNIELTAKDENTYSATIIQDMVLDLNNNTEYSVFVNGQVCETIDSGTGYIMARYGYVFLGNNKEELCRDILTINIAFYENSTGITVLTNGGAEAHKYWNYYFNKNDFVVEIKPATYIKDKDITFGEGLVGGETTEEFCLATFVSKGETIHTEYVLLGNKYTKDIVVPEVPGCEFLGWSLDGKNIVDVTDYTFTHDMTFVALFGSYVSSTYQYNLARYDDDVLVNGNLDFYLELVTESLGMTNNIDIDLSRSRINVSLCSHSGSYAGNYARVLTINGSNFGVQQTISASSLSFSDYKMTGNCYLTINKDGSFVVNKGDFKIGYNSGSLVSGYFNLYIDSAELYFITT